jgi:hypothetical protein
MNKLAAQISVVVGVLAACFLGPALAERCRTVAARHTDEAKAS